MHLMDLLNANDDGSWPDIPPIRQPADLLAVHAELIRAGSRDPLYLKAADLLNQLSQSWQQAANLEASAPKPRRGWRWPWHPAPTASEDALADAQHPQHTANLMFTTLIEDLRTPPADETPLSARFEIARHWLSHLRMWTRAAQAARPLRVGVVAVRAVSGPFTGYAAPRS